MNKKIIAAFLSLILITPTAANAALKNSTVVQPTLAILDTAIDTSLPIFKGKIVHEVCILEWNSCPNGTSFMEGSGAATMPVSLLNKEGFEHGTQMAQAAISANPNLNIVFVRIIGMNSLGSRQIANETTFVNAMKWVLNNKDRFNIQALSMSQGHHNVGSGTNYCPSTPNTEGIISSLVSSGIPVFLPAGNYRDKTRVSWPACIKSAVTISATAIGDGPATYTNYDKNITDFFANGSMQTILPGGSKINTAGTSISAQVAAGIWIKIKEKYPTYSYQQIYDLMNNKSIKLPSRSMSGRLLLVENFNNV